jgi:hypothetical protein
VSAPRIAALRAELRDGDQRFGGCGLGEIAVSAGDVFPEVAVQVGL